MRLAIFARGSGRGYFERDELDAHHVTIEEAIECFFLDFEVRRNKSYRDRYQLWGRTLGGRQLKIIFQLGKSLSLFRFGLKQELAAKAA